MKLTVLVDNNTLIDHYFQGEPAVCYYIEDHNTSILFDTGYSNLFLENAKTLHINLSNLSSIVLSHGHNDHTGGLKFLTSNPLFQNIQLIAHPDVFKSRTEGGKEIGSPLTQTEIEKVFDLKLSKIPIRISKNILFLGEIPAYHSFEKRKSIGFITENEKQYEDFVADDSAIVYQGDKGLFIITGCSHSGICNIIEHAKNVCKEQKILGIIGGFHLFERSPKLFETINYFKKNQIKNLYPCHCVSFQAKAEIHKAISIIETGVGIQITV